MHEKYEKLHPTGSYNDIALCWIEEPFILSPFTQPISLPSIKYLEGKDVRKKYSFCTVYGRGHIRPEGKIITGAGLRKLNMPIISEVIKELLITLTGCHNKNGI